MTLIEHRQPEPLAREPAQDRAPSRSILAPAGTPFRAVGGAANGRLIRFLAVGLLNTAFGYGLFAAIYAALGSHRAAIVMATIGGVIFNFVSTGRLVFANAALSRLASFLLGYAVVMTLNIGLIDFAVAVGISPLLGQAFALPAMAGLAFLINDRFVFRRGR